ncbi:pyridoxamine 5'-phosphate oxidase family protein [Erythrobacter arachoides]|uniref:Pyridoxamine 5'-phosphate oxidase family protein n=1 Tax=Aurantiacibacter arachoides TaxID=1850444 RepID=A0A845A3N9_9SPHN|nr:pyridoxamine 5'-phosphate oxidase family protein [Aurantiacibacter arachoides]MXO94538.1 pyridoxamine 5'-phosphate oxidase family protein [Aurantiacibacter arachoides]GGD62693.1 pyridoxamine 5'-phosphate oxidase [Aurantiacibacter arachoides]
MADFYDTLTDDHIAMIEAQPVFFVATAAQGARINLSPKGLAHTLRVLGPDRVAYLDLGGSGNETNAHLIADGRITIMVCNFQNPALILRIYGQGAPVLPWESGWTQIAAHFTLLPGTRQIFDIAVESVQTSCGWGVPIMDYERERQTLVKYHARADPLEWAGKHKRRRTSIDGLPARTTDRYIAGPTPPAVTD